LQAAFESNKIFRTNMKSEDEHRWDLEESEDGNLPSDEDAFEKKLEEWERRDWASWLSSQLRFPFTVTREEDEDDAYFQKGAAKALFRLGHTMEVVGLDAESDEMVGILITVRESGKTGQLPLCDVEVKPKTDPNYWPVREYVVWFANRCF
jgi:hypothetical protein